MVMVVVVEVVVVVIVVVFVRKGKSLVIVYDFPTGILLK